MTALIILIISMLVTSATSSMVEAAILSMPLIKARILYENKRRGATDLLIIKEDIHAAVATIVVINNAVNIIGSIFVGEMVTMIFGRQWLGIASAVLTFSIIIFSEMIPKTIGEHYKVPISLISAKPLRFIIFVLRPLVFIVTTISSFVRKRSTLPKVTEEEIKIMLQLGKKEGTVEVNEEVLCDRVFKLNDLKALQMMKPIDKVYALPAGKKLLDIKDAIIGSPYSRIVIYEKDPADIVGICQHRVLLKEISKGNYDAGVKEFMTKPIFVGENEKADTLLEKFQAYRQHLFVVQNKEGKNAGIISMEDVLEELFGEIYDEKDLTLEKQ